MRPNQRKGQHRLSLYFSDSEFQTLTEISDYWGTNRSEALRTMIRYFEVNLGLRKKK